MNEISIDQLMEHSDSIFRFALSRVRDHHTAEDLVQECLVTAWQRRETFKGNSSLGTWLTGIMKFKVLDHFRKAARTPTARSLDSDSEDDPLDSLFDSHGSWKIDPNHGLDFLAKAPDQNAWHNEILEKVRQCLAKLPERLRMLFNLREINGLDVPSAAAAAGVTPGSAAVLLTRSRQKLRICLQQQDIHP